MTAGDTEPNIGDLVDYFGSLDDHHGSRFVVTAVDEFDRLALVEHSLGLLHLRHVRRISVERAS